jgi:hypothetical protein
MPAYPFAGDLTRRIRRMGAEVWICTTRPYLRLDNIDPDTREWLRRNRIQHDAVIFGEGKYSELVRQVGIRRIVAVVDDLPEQVTAAYKLKLCPIYLMDQPYNKGIDGGGIQYYDSRVVTRISNLKELWEDLEPILKEARKGLAA